MNIFYLGRDTLACKAVIFMLSNHLQVNNVTFVSVDDGEEPCSDIKYDISILDDDSIENNLDIKIKTLKNADAPLILLTSKNRKIKTLHNILPELRGVVDRNGNTDFFIEAVCAVGAGGYCYSWDVLNTDLRHAGQFDDAACEKASLTAREREILKFCLAGESNKSISRILSRSEKTISAHKSNMMKKLGIKSWQLHESHPE